VLLLFLLGCGLFVEVSVLAETLPLPEENTWVEIPAMRHKRSYFGTVAIEGKIYVMGGFEHSSAVLTGAMNDPQAVVGTVEMYDPQTNNWTDKTPMPIRPYRFAAVEFMGKIYCIGIQRDSHNQYVGVNIVYDPVTDQWEEKTPMPTPRTWAAVCVVNGGMYVRSGHTSLDGVCEVYNPATDTWSGGQWPAVSDKDIIFYNTGIVFVNRIYVAYGEYVFDNRTYVFYGSGIRIYDVGLDGWVGGPDLPLGLYGMGVVEVGGLLYVLSGCTATYSFPFYMESPELVPVGRAFVYTPLGYGRIPPEICVWSFEEGGIYDFGNVRLELGLSHPVIWVGYSLNGQANVTVEGNVTLSGLSNGVHNIRVFAEDKYGNMGASETITFTVINAPLSMSFIIAIIVGVVVFGVVVCVGSFLFLRKRRFSKSLQADTVDGAQK